MDLKEYLIADLEDAHRMVDIALDDLTPEVAHFEPGGTANTIAQLLCHVTMGEDNAINRVIQGGQSILEAEGWYTKTGIPEGRGAIWQKGWTLNLDAFREYREKVKASGNAFIKDVDISGLDREVEWFNGPRPASSLLQLVVIHHILGHAGEISALKGVQGLKGLPF